MVIAALARNIDQISLLMLTQGVGSGVASPLLYSMAIPHLGVMRCAVVGALALVVASLLAVPTLGEIPTSISVAGIGLVAAGVMLANRR
ncbi:EamA family transporter [Pantoea sp. Tr-811]|uniref:EamA family transporter n=1 Tax=Pantoea sp. Tr-811 TaxID=2608361 RepID=UPI00351AB184|nr:EamA family transporter [Pantoea sp. Tr-811]